MSRQSGRSSADTPFHPPNMPSPPRTPTDPKPFSVVVDAPVASDLLESASEAAKRLVVLTPQQQVEVAAASNTYIGNNAIERLNSATIKQVGKYIGFFDEDG
jgi:hypothetical protein